MVFCWVYPFYTLALNSNVNGMIGNIATVALAGYVFFSLWPLSRKAAWLVFPIMPWVIYASFTIYQHL